MYLSVLIIELVVLGVITEEWMLSILVLSLGAVISVGLGLLMSTIGKMRVTQMEIYTATKVTEVNIINLTTTMTSLERSQKNQEAILKKHQYDILLLKQKKK